MAIVPRKNVRGVICSYQVKLRDKEGQWYESPSFLKRTDALNYEAKLLKDKNSGLLRKSKDAQIYTVREYFEVWSVENRSSVSAGWKISQDQMYRAYIEPVIGDLKMIEVDEPAIGRVLNRMRSSREMPDGRARGEQTIKHVYSLLRSMFGDAVGYYKMLRECPVNSKFHRPKVHEGESRYLKPEQCWQLLNHVKSTWMGRPIWVCALAGFRTEAMIPLTWDCIDWELNHIQIKKAWKQKVRRVENYPKGKSWELVPMIPPLRAYLYSIWKESLRPEALVCPGPRGTQLATETFAQNLKRICLELGVPIVSPHGLRHSCSELFVRQGATQEDIRRLLNHKSVNTTRRYIHRTDDRLRRIADLVTQPEGENSEMFPNMFPNGNKSTYVAPKKGVTNVQ